MSKKLLDPNSWFIQMQIDFATEYGVNVALLAGKLLRLEKELGGKVDNEGNKWIRLTAEEWHKELPFFSERTIWTAIKEATDYDILLTRTFKGRPKWYRLNPDFMITRNSCELYLADVANPTRNNSELPRVLIQESNPKESTTKALAEFEQLFNKHFGKLNHEPDDPLRLDVMATIKANGLDKVAAAIHTATVDRADGKPKSWGYVKGILSNPDKPNGGSNGTSRNDTTRDISTREAAIERQKEDWGD